MNSDPILWPAPTLSKTNIGRFISFINQNFNSYDELYKWSIDNSAEFWKAVWDFSGIIHSGAIASIVSNENQLWPRPDWFKGASLNFAENLLKDRSDRTAIIYKLESKPEIAISYRQLHDQVARLAAWMKDQGLKSGDVVAGFVTNCPEAIVAMLATTALGGVWTSCSPDAGSQFAADRFAQTHPKIFIGLDYYIYDGKTFDTQSKVAEITAQIPSLMSTLSINQMDEIIGENQPVPNLEFEQVPFDHPLYILYSSGTTGKPKAIVHGVGGTLLQHIKEHRLQSNLGPDDRFFYFTTTSWMMWNWMVTGLATGLTLVVYEGKPDPASLWKLVKDLRVTAFGTSAPWISLSQKSKIKPDLLPDLKLLLSTGAPLLREHFDYLYENIPDVQVASISGGTDIISCFAGGGPVAVRRGRLQCLGLGTKVEVWNDAGESIFDQQGELVCTQPFPCMPIYFLNDPDGALYKAAYFEKFPGVWSHGDFAIRYDDNSLEIIGRSDNTIKRHGVRIGTSDIYNALAQNSQIDDALAVGRRIKDNEEIVLFVKLRSGVEAASTLKRDIRQTLTAQSPWLKPDHIFFVADIPYTSNGKKSEVLIKNIVNGRPATNQSVLRNPDCLPEYVAFAQSLRY